MTFLGGMFVGILRINMNEEFLKEWFLRTVEVVGISEEENNGNGLTTETPPQERLELNKTSNDVLNEGDFLREN